MRTAQPLQEYRFPVEDLAAVATAPGPFVSVYLTTEAAVEKAAHRSEVRWKDLRRELSGQGAPAKVLDAIDPLVPDAHLHGGSLAVIATPGDGVLHVELGPRPTPSDIGLWRPVPALLPIVEWRQGHIPHLIILADRTGADLIAVTRARSEVTATAEGPDDVIHKVPTGGWSQRRHQQRAEDSWEHNADAVARQAAKMASSAGAEMMFGAGDVRALAYLRRSLPVEWRSKYHEVKGARDVHLYEHVREQVEELVAQESAQRTAELLDRLREELGQGDLGREGTAPVAEALQAAQVELVFLAPGPENDVSAWFGPEPNEVALGREPLEDLGVRDPQEGPFVDVVARAALGTSAGIRIVPPNSFPREGVGALLRWATKPS